MARVCLHAALPAVKIVDIGHVSKQYIFLIAQAGGQERRQGGVVHLCLVALQHSSHTEQHNLTLLVLLLFFFHA